MYTLDLICSNGHRFDGWFGSRSAFERQLADALICCPHCSDTNVKQIISPARIKKHAEESKAPVAQEKPPTILEYIEKNFDDVGKKFADEAMKIHVGDAEKRNIRGQATIDEEKMLSEEGVPFFKMPELQ